MRKKIVAGNWKMNQNKAEAVSFIEALVKEDKPQDVQMMIAPSYVMLDACKQAATDELVIASQNISQHDKGAYTGEVSADMLKSIGVKTAIIGHSERRSIFGETHEILAEKVKQAINNSIQVVFCVGESLEEREAEKAESTVKSQLEDSLFFLSEIEMKNVIIAYEPVWAIGTGKTASPEQAQEMHAFIRSLIVDKYNQHVADATSILYGGSVKPSNAKELFAQPDVDGGLVGGASLKVDSFVELLHSFK